TDLVLTKTICGVPRRLFVYVALTALVAVPLIAVAMARIALDPPSASTGATVALFFALALVADLRPVPMDDNGKSEVSIASVFIVTSAILFGWRYAVPLAALSIGITYTVARRPPIRTAFNVSMYAIAAFGAALPVIVFRPIHGSQPGQ